ncbi:MAG: HAD family hydrolase [Bacillota bacterium]|nr:HAD family hydrolase [Bacillota bacterium]
MQAAIFDMDGTLLDTLNTIAYFANKALNKFGFLAAPVQNYRQYAGNGAIKLIERAMSYTGNYTKEQFNEVYSYYVKIYDENPLYLTAPYVNILEILRVLKKEGCKVGILSNKPHAATLSIAEKLIGKNLFDLCIGARDNYPLKPDPTVALEMVKELGADKEKSFFVGDTYVDIATGKAAGLYSIGVLWGFRDEKELLEAGADIIISDAREIVKIKDRLKNDIF